MNTRWLSIWFAVVAALPQAGAHRLDEYLQATRLSIDLDRIDVEIDLTAGAAVASQVFSWIDSNRDGEISSTEGEAYAQQMLRSVVLSIDGRPVPVTLVETHFPQLSDMRLGVGTIRLRATAKVPFASGGRHQVSFVNAHRAESSVYLVNALVPENPRIQLADPQRDRAQHGITLDYTVASEGPSARTFSLLAGLLMAGVWFLRGGYVLTRPSHAGVHNDRTAT